MPNDAHLLLIDKHTVESLLQPDDVLQAVREAFELHSRGEGRVFPVVRESLSTGGVFGIKSGDVPAQGLLGLLLARYGLPGDQQPQTFMDAYNLLHKHGKGLFGAPEED